MVVVEEEVVEVEVVDMVVPMAWELGDRCMVLLTWYVGGTRYGTASTAGSLSIPTSVSTVLCFVLIVVFEISMANCVQICV